MNRFSKLVIAIVPALVMFGCGSKGEVKDAGAEGGVQQGRAGGVTTGGAATGGTAGAATAGPSGMATGGGGGAAGSAGDMSGGSAAAGGSAGTPGSAMTGVAGGAAQAGGAAKPGMMPTEMKIYFDFDKSEIKPEFRATLQAHVAFLAANPGAKVTIEGHCDERGTREYNLALGERRAHSVQQFLVLQGVGKDQVKTVTFGEERPDAAGHDESAWKFNRRAVFIYAK